MARFGAFIALATIALIGACSGDSEPKAEDTGPIHKECQPVPAATLEQITTAFTAPVKVKSAYMVQSQDIPGFAVVTLGTDGFPQGVSHKDGETPAPTFAVLRGKIYTASGQAMRYVDEKIPDQTEIPYKWDELPGGYLDNDATNMSFECVQADLED